MHLETTLAIQMCTTLESAWDVSPVRCPSCSSSSQELKALRPVCKLLALTAARVSSSVDNAHIAQTAPCKIFLPKWVLKNCSRGSASRPWNHLPFHGRTRRTHRDEKAFRPRADLWIWLELCFERLDRMLNFLLGAAGSPAGHGIEHAASFPTALPLGHAHASDAAPGRTPASCAHHSSHIIKPFFDKLLSTPLLPSNLRQLACSSPFSNISIIQWVARNQRPASSRRPPYRSYRSIPATPPHSHTEWAPKHATPANGAHGAHSTWGHPWDDGPTPGWVPPPSPPFDGVPRGAWAAADAPHPGSSSNDACDPDGAGDGAGAHALPAPPAGPDDGAPRADDDGPASWAPGRPPPPTPASR